MATSITRIASDILRCAVVAAVVDTRCVSVRFNCNCGNGTPPTHRYPMYRLRIVSCRSVGIYAHSRKRIRLHTGFNRNEPSGDHMMGEGYSLATCAPSAYYRNACYQKSSIFINNTSTFGFEHGFRVPTIPVDKFHDAISRKLWTFSLRPHTHVVRKSSKISLSTLAAWISSFTHAHRHRQSHNHTRDRKLEKCTLPSVTELRFEQKSSPTIFIQNGAKHWQESKRNPEGQLLKQCDIDAHT